MKPIQAFEKISKDLQILQSRYFHALLALNTFEAFKFLKSPSHSGKHKVHDNLKILNRYPYFFQMAEEVNRFYFLIEVSKYFDKDPKTLSLYQVIKEIELNKHKLTKDNFLQYQESIGKPKVKMDSLFQPITNKDLASWRRRLRTLQPIINKVWRYRCESLAHEAYSKTFRPISRSEILKLFRGLSILLNKMTVKIDFSTTSRMSTKEVVQDIRRLVVDLKAFRESIIKSV